jgi:hypothetical protein
MYRAFRSDRVQPRGRTEHAQTTEAVARLGSRRGLLRRPRPPEAGPALIRHGPSVLEGSCEEGPREHRTAEASGRRQATCPSARSRPATCPSARRHQAARPATRRCQAASPSACSRQAASPSACSRQAASPSARGRQASAPPGGRQQAAETGVRSLQHRKIRPRRLLGTDQQEPALTAFLPPAKLTSLPGGLKIHGRTAPYVAWTCAGSVNLRNLGLIHLRSDRKLKGSGAIEPRNSRS